MKYKSHYESVQNCTPGSTELQLQQHQQQQQQQQQQLKLLLQQQLVNDMNVDEVSKSITSLSGEDLKKSVKRKTCTCSSGMVPCPSHAGTERSSMNGYTNSYTQIKINNSSKNNSKTTINTSKDEMPPQTQNGKIPTKPKLEEVFAEDDELLSSRTFTIEPSNSHHVDTSNNNCDNSNKGEPCLTSNLDELRLSLTSLISKDTERSTTADDEKQATESFQKWLTEKKRQEREIRQREQNLKQLIEQEKQRKIQMEQENFLNWLHSKKEKERQEKETKKKALQEEQRRKNEKLKREEINKKQYQLWLKLKEEQDLVKKINEQKKKIEKEERERLRLARNQSAFQEWLISSKDKPKPVPLNRGLESLRTSTSVAFVNPAPWVPNIVEKTKASSK